MNKKGFTLVELITTFALTTVIIILLLNVAVAIKDVYSKSNIKSQLYIEQANLSNQLNSKINKHNLSSYQECTDEEFCYIFNLVSGESIKLTVTEKTIKFGDYVYNLDNKSTIKNPSVDIEYVNLDNVENTSSFLIINIPIVNELYSDINFGVNVVYRF